MWVFTPVGMIAAVQEDDTPDLIRVRARTRVAIEQTGFPYRETPTHDYAFLAIVDRADWLDWLLSAGQAIDYHSLKASVIDDDLHDVYNDVWLAMLDQNPPGFGRYNVGYYSNRSADDDEMNP